MPTVVQDAAVVVCLAGYRHLPPLADEDGACEAGVRVLEGVGIARADIVTLVDPDLSRVREAVADVRGDGRLWVYLTGYLAHPSRGDAPWILGLGARSASASNGLRFSELGADVVLVDAVAAPGTEPELGITDWNGSPFAVGAGSVATLLVGGADGLLEAADGIVVADELRAGIALPDPIASRVSAVWTEARCEPLARVPDVEPVPYAWPDGPAPLLALSDAWQDPLARATAACNLRYSEARLKGMISHDGRGEMRLRLASLLLLDAEAAVLGGSQERARERYARAAMLSAVVLDHWPGSENAGYARPILGRAQAALGEPAAEATLRLAAANGDGGAALALGDLLAEAGRLAEAVVAYERASGEWAIHAKYRVGWAHRRMGDPQAARREWLAVLAMADAEPERALAALRLATSAALGRLHMP